MCGLERRVGVVFAEHVDADRRLSRVADLVEGDRTRDAVVVGDAASDDDRGAVSEGRALLAVAGTTRDLLQLGSDLGTVGRAGGQGGQRDQGGGVERLGRVAVVLQRVSAGLLQERVELTGEVTDVRRLVN